MCPVSRSPAGHSEELGRSLPRSSARKQRAGVATHVAINTSHEEALVPLEQLSR